MNINYYSCSPIEASCQLVPLCQQLSVRSIDGWNSGKLLFSRIPSNIIYPVPESHFFELILLYSLHYTIGQLFPTYQSDQCEAHVRNNSNITTGTCLERLP